MNRMLRLIISLMLGFVGSFTVNHLSRIGIIPAYGGIMGGDVDLSIGGFLISLVLISVVVFFTIGRYWADQLNQKLTGNIQGIEVREILMNVVGIIVGLIIANLLGIAVLQHRWTGTIIVIILNILLGSFGLYIVQIKKDEIQDFIGCKALGQNSAKPKILDTSVIIDGRILDILKTGFIEGKILIPTFVLEELRHIADSSDNLKRNRGRRGLDILNEIQSQLKVAVEITEVDYRNIKEVDSKLLKMAEKMDGVVVTNDFNLNKVANFQGVTVFNINELANAIKPVVLPGEDMQVTVIKDGKEDGQGIGYLNDGTMIVVEGGRHYIGDKVDVIVTSVLQTAAGRMIFTKIQR